MENYIEAIDLFKKVLPKEKDSIAIMLYIGNSYLALGKYDSAVYPLTKVMKSESRYKTQAKWYLALSYLALDKRDLAIKHFESIKNSSTTYSKKAERILETLE